VSQIVVCQNAKGIVLAADGMAVDVNVEGQLVYHTVDRLIQLSQRAAILAGGVAESVQMCHALKNFIKEEGLDTVEDICAAALPFLGTEFERFMRNRCDTLPVDPIHHVYFILAGQMGKDRERPYRSYFIWTKKRLPQLDSDEIGLAYSVPRIMGLEVRLGRLCSANSNLNDMLSEIVKTVEEKAGREDEIGPPFSYAFITREGFKKIDHRRIDRP